MAVGSTWSLAPGCDSRSHGEGPADTRLLASLNADEERSLCRAQNELVARDPDHLEGACFAKAMLLSDGDAQRCEQVHVNCLRDPSPACDVRSPPPYAMIAKMVNCPKITVGMVLACNRANGPRAKVGYEGISCQSDIERVQRQLEQLLEDQLSDPADGCEPVIDACPVFQAL